jgi:hypothetical protein
MYLLDEDFEVSARNCNKTMTSTFNLQSQDHEFHLSPAAVCRELKKCTVGIMACSSAIRLKRAYQELGSRQQQRV